MPKDLCFIPLEIDFHPIPLLHDTDLPMIHLNKGKERRLWLLGGYSAGVCFSQFLSVLLSLPSWFLRRVDCYRLLIPLRYLFFGYCKVFPSFIGVFVGLFDRVF